MKKVLLVVLMIATWFSAMASGIYGLDQDDINSLDRALLKCNRSLMNYKKINQLPNRLEDYVLGDMNLSYGVLHNFIINVGAREVLNLRDSVVVSGLFSIEPGGIVLLDGSIISNMTFRGDMSGVSMNDSCIVRTNFEETKNLRQSDALGHARYSSELELPSRSLIKIILGK